ncbi:MAG TPA: chitinase [Mycobacteriales bacterium]|nr:chitinase [Mycobacteriales bacterium]
MQRSRILPRIAVAALVAGVTVVGANGPAGAAQTVRATAVLPTNWYGSAPYLMPLDNDPPDPVAVMAATGQKAVQLAFILSGGGCTPAWDGTAPVSTDTQVAAMVAEIRAAGGDVTVSAGGAAGTKLGQVCSSPATTAAAYQQVIDTYGLRAIDLDLEEPEIENATAINNELAAAQILQGTNPGLYVAITMPTLVTGANFFGQALLNDARSLSFVPTNYSIMPFDGGFTGAADQIAALTAFHTQLMATFGWSAAVAYQHEGVSLMDGRSDTGEMFDQAAFGQVLDYATTNGMSRYTFWSLNRDRVCDPPNPGRTFGTCSSVPQDPWDFTRFTVTFAGATPPPPTSPPPSAPPPACDAPGWTATAVYVGGDRVTFDGHLFTAKWWTQGETPGAADVWADQGACDPSAGGTGGGLTCAAAWSSTAVYVAGDEATLDGHLFTAKWWTQGETPGLAAVWTDNGPCTG